MTTALVVAGIAMPSFALGAFLSFVLVNWSTRR